MPPCQKVVRPLAQCIRNAQISSHSAISIRTFTSSSRSHEPVTETTSFTPVFDPATVTSVKGEKALMRSGVLPIGSRRRRAAVKSSDNIPFEQLPYQAFQEALKLLKADREEKMEQIKTVRLRISNLEAQDVANIKGGEKERQNRLFHMREYLEWLKIQADINDPLIKKRFEDGEGDMNKPIYRYLADRKWRQYQRLVIVQRVNQLSVVPDLLPHFEPTAEVRLAFKQRSVQPGEYVDSRVSELAPRLKVQVFDKGERLVTVVVVDGDVPLLDEDTFMHRCHYLAANIPISPTETSLPLSKAQESQLVLSYLPPFAQKGSPYHRYSVFVLEQSLGKTLDVEALKKDIKRDGFSLRSFTHKQELKPIGVGIFRSLWDEGTAGVMQRADIEGADMEFKRKRIPALKPKQKARGWEARHASDKYKSLRR